MEHRTLILLERNAFERERLPQLIHNAREAGMTWEAIAKAAQMSRAGVIKALARYTP